MKVIIDILTPKQFMFFPKIARRLEKRGHDVRLVSRKYREVSQLIKRISSRVDVIGKHGGRSLKGKLDANVKRIAALIPIFEDMEPDVAVSFSSPELARASFGLGVPHISVNDSPHASAVARLTIPLSQKLLCPFVIPKNEWTIYGISEDRIIHYNALDPWVWLKDFQPDVSVIEELSLNPDKPIITMRVPEIHASYLLNNETNMFSSIEFMKTINSLREDVQIVVVPRYKEQIEMLLESGAKINVCKNVVDGPSLLYYSDVFIGAGGTMSAEAALIGVPTFSSYPGTSYLIEKFLVEKDLMVKEKNYRLISKKVLKLLETPTEARQIQTSKAQELVSCFEDPTNRIVSEIENVKDD
jgi:predicted glycosyltransferase